MDVYPSLDAFLALAREGNLIPVTTELMADFETPVSVYRKLRALGEPAFLLESIEGGIHVNRYSFIGCRPRMTVTSRLGGTTALEYRDGRREEQPTPDDPLSVIQEALAGDHPVKLPGMPRFVGGAVGYIAYEYAHVIEPTVPLAEADPLGMPMLHFLFTDTLVIFDRARQTLRLLANARLADHASPREAYAAAAAQLSELVALLSEGRAVPTVPVVAPGALEVPESNHTPERFRAMIERCKAYIRSGDVIQVVGSQRFSRPFEPDPLTLYRALRVINPSPYMFLYDPGPFALVGASPEVHVRLTDGLAELRPIAGSRPRGATPEADLAFEREMLADAKEGAEHLMLVDLGRNDLGRVCDYGSVQVRDYRLVERYSHIMHIVSQVEGRLRAGEDAFSLMRATFPAGTVSGAPKVRAMQIIAELEREQRGPYSGAVCYFSYDGNVDSCIALRTGLLQGGQLILQSGAGLVADSEPQAEYQESINKATALLRAAVLAEHLHRG